MPKCEITNINQMAVQKCLHPKCEGKYIGYMTCKKGIKIKDGIIVCNGPCSNFIEGAGTEDIWCRLRKEKLKNKERTSIREV